MANRYRDFDAAFAEAAEEPLTIRLFGQDWQLPSRLPAVVVLRLRRANAAVTEFLQRLKDAGLDMDDPIPDDFEFPEGWEEFTKTDEIAHAKEVCGADNVDAWLAKGIDLPGLRDIVAWVVSVHEGRAAGDEDDAEGNASGRPKPADRQKPTSKHAAGRSGSKRTRSSNAGRSSKPTSSARTASASRARSKTSPGESS